MTSPWTGKKISCLLATLLLLLTLFGTAHADGGENPLEQEIAGYHINLVFEGPPQVGANEVLVKLRAENGASVHGAIVAIEVEESDNHVDEAEGHAKDTMEMGNDSHTENTKQETNADTHSSVETVTLESGHESGAYHGSITLPKAGRWQVNVHFNHQGAEHMVSFPMTIASGFSKAGVLGGFFTVNLAAIVTAAFLKRKTAAAKNAANTHIERNP